MRYLKKGRNFSLSIQEIASASENLYLVLFNGIKHVTWLRAFVPVNQAIKLFCGKNWWQNMVLTAKYGAINHHIVSTQKKKGCKKGKL